MNSDNDFETFMHLHNNAPVDDFSGLTPNEMYRLLHDVYSEHSPIRLANEMDDNTLNQIPLFRLAEIFLRILERENTIKLTPGGALPQRILVELYDKRIILEDAIEQGYAKVRREIDCRAIQSARITVELAGFVKKTKGKLSLTKAGSKVMVAGDRNIFFKKFIQTYTNKFAWSFNDFFTEAPIGQLGWAFSVILLDRFGGHSLNARFYANKYLKAFPNSLLFFQPNYSTPEEYFVSCYSFRTFAQFFEWFGFVSATGQRNILTGEEKKYSKTLLLNKIFLIEN